MPQPNQTARLALATAALSALATAQQTWTVASAGGGQFTQITAAVAAAVDGDLILVGPGTYDPFTVSGKGLTIVGATVFQTGFGPGPASPTITIENLAPHQQVHLIDAVAFNAETPIANVLLRNCAGTIWIEDLFSDSYGAAALRVDNCADVVLVDFFAQTNSGFTLPDGTPVPKPGAHFRASTVHGHDCDFTGSHGVLQSGGFPTATSEATGGHGIEVVDSHVVLHGGTVSGGSGNGLWTGTCLTGSDGGHGAILATLGGPAPELRLRDVSIRGGGPGYQTCGTSGVPGQPTVALAGRVVVRAGRARSLDSPHESLAPATLGIDLEGDAGDLALVFASFPAPTLPLADLALHLAAPPLTLGFATLDSTHRGGLTIALPPLPSASHHHFALQALVLDAGGAMSTTNPSTLLIR